MGERLRRAMTLRGMEVVDIVNAKVMSRANVYLILNGTTKPDKIRDETVTALCRVLRINREWLLTGKGAIEGATEKADDTWSDVTGYAQAIGLGSGPEAQEYAETHKLKFRADSLARKRLNPAKLAVMYGAGESMEPRIRQGDAILFDTSDVKPRDGQLYVVMVPGAGGKEYQVKRCEIIDDIVFFRADNPGGDHNWKKPKRMDSKRTPVEVIGRVRWIAGWED